VPIERIQLSQQARIQLLKLKRATGIERLDVLCRWAFCTSLAEPAVPADARLSGDGKLEMSWQVFGGPHHQLYAALLEARCRRDGLATDEETLGTQLRLHLHRGIGYLFAGRRIRRIGDLFGRLPVTSPPTPRPPAQPVT
jgi:DNA sulfur modification protein DndE